MVADIQPLLQTNAIHLLINVRVVPTRKKRAHFLEVTNRFVNKSCRFELDLREIKWCCYLIEANPFGD